MYVSESLARANPQLSLMIGTTLKVEPPRLTFHFRGGNDPIVGAFIHYVLSHFLRMQLRLDRM